MRIFRTLKVLVPAMVACLGIMVICTGYLRHRKHGAETVLQGVRGDAYRDGTRLSGISQHLLRKNLRQTADLEMSYASMSPTLDLGIICDGHDKVLHATQLQWRDLQLAETPMAPLQQILQDARSTMSGQVRIAENGGSIWAVFPFYEKDGDSKGAVMLAYDLRYSLLEARRASVHESIAQGLALLAGCIVLWLLLDGLITRRIQRILDYAGKVGEGETAVMEVRGDDEIAVVAQRFADTVNRLRDTELQLLEAGEQERRRVGRDLHDDVCQRITAAQLKVGVLGSSLRKEGSQHQARAMEVAEELSKAAEIARGCARGLAPGALDVEGLDQALEDLAAHVGNLFGVTVICHSHLGQIPLESADQVHLFRIAQELVTNAAKHARPSLIEIRCAAEDRVLRLEVENDGQPFPDHSVASRGLGLQLVRQRIRALGGQIHFHPRNDGLSGTLALCEVPV